MKYKHECSKLVSVKKQAALRVLEDEDRARGVPTTPQQAPAADDDEEEEEDEDAEMAD